MRRNPFAWFLSLHAKLFTVTALVTSLLTIAVAYSITRNSRREMEKYTCDLAIETSQAIETEILQRWEHDLKDFKEPRPIEEFLETLAGPDRSIFQIDVFRRNPDDSAALVTSSADDRSVDFGPEIGSYMRALGPVPELVKLNTGNRAWKVYLPIRNPKPGKPPVGLIRTYCDLEHWETVWQKNLRNTWLRLPMVLLGEFIILWVIVSSVVSEPVRGISEAMARLEQGDASARIVVGSQDELGAIADRFNLMAAQLQRAGREREALIEEIRGLNAGLQARIDEALAEVQAKNQELERLMAGNALLREELAQQERLAVAGQLTATFAHEVGTPLNLVDSHLQMVLGQPDLPARASERLGVVHAQIARVGDIVRRMMSVTRRPQLVAEPVPLEALVSELHNLWAPSLASRGVAFTASVPSACLLQVDRRQMEQLFINLVNNSVDAMPEGGKLSLEATRGPEGFWTLALRDTGAGIPAELQAKVFRPMFTTKPDGQGTGLGLAICREIVRAHGGEIQVESAPGAGTAMIFNLPAVG